MGELLSIAKDQRKKTNKNQDRSDFSKNFKAPCRHKSLNLYSTFRMYWVIDLELLEEIWSMRRKIQINVEMMISVNSKRQEGVWGRREKGKLPVLT